MTAPVLEVDRLKVYFPIYGGLFFGRSGEVKAVDGISFRVGRGQTLGLVGESGCGKTTAGKAIVNILRGAEIEGRIMLGVGDRPPVDLVRLGRQEMLPHRAHLQMIFQDPYSSLNPRLTVQDIVEEPLLVHRREMKRSERVDRVVWLLEKVGLSAEQARRFPHEFSGGQRQRVGIARALATNPSVIVADEPVSALDVSIQAQTINLLEDLQQEFGLSYIFIAHDLSVVEHISDILAVMYLGDIVEIGNSDDVYERPMHPYTQALLSAVPLPDPTLHRPDRTRLSGEVPSPLAKPSGCGFRTRCPLARASCAAEKPTLVDSGDGRQVACPVVLEAE
jgi:oligopeptide transport system ATP-binding protein